MKKDAHYLSKFVIGAGVRLFDYSLNAVWNEVVINLRKKAAVYGLDIVFDAAVGVSKAREYYSTENDLSSIKDSVLLHTCRKRELISDTTYKKLSHILDMRNDIGISNPNSYSINAYELLGYLQNCIEDVLNDNPTAAALQVQSFSTPSPARRVSANFPHLLLLSGLMHEVSTKIGGHLVMEEDEQKLRVRLVGRNGRRRYDPASKDRLVAAALSLACRYRVLPIWPCCDRAAGLRWICLRLVMSRWVGTQKGCTFFLSSQGERIAAERREAGAGMRRCGCVGSRNRSARSCSHWALI